MYANNLKYALALNFLKGVGAINAKKLISYTGSFEDIFKLSKKDLSRIDGVGSVLANNLNNQFNDQKLWRKVDEELEFVVKHNIQYYIYKSKEYPFRLSQCEDAPLVLFSRGNINLNKQKILSIVGTRNITDYGKLVCENLIQEFANEDILIVSGLAYGVDTWAHKLSVKNNLQTVGVLAHGLDRIYPATNKKLAQDMMINGGVITEFPSNTNPDRENFPKRNRIIAGIADATLVIESASKGGSLITADIANSYSRDVFAIPGRITDDKSAGCNYLIRTQQAHAISSGEELLELMNWKEEKQSKPQQSKLFVEYSVDEQKIADCFTSKGPIHIESLFQQTGFNNAKASMVLLQMEMKGMIKSLPGKLYQLN